MSGELIDVSSGYLSIQDFDMAEAMHEEMDGLEISFDKIKVPSGGVLSYEMPSDDPDAPDSVKEFSGVIIYHHPTKVFYMEKYTGGNAPPDCCSYDGKSGSGDPGGLCKCCPMNEFGTALDDGNGKGCKDRRRVYVLLEGEAFPLLLSLPVGSLKNFTSYVKRLLSKRKKVAHVVTKFSLGKATNSKGIAYSQARFAVDRDLSPEEKQIIDGMSEQIRTLSRNVGFEDDAAPPDIIVDPDTGELVGEPGGKEAACGE